MDKLNKKKFSCDDCNYTTNNRTGFIRHTRTHTGEKPYKCAICEKTFAIKGNRNRHQATHGEGKQFQCEICQVRFSDKSTVKRHMRIHTGEKLFECDICLRKFYQMSAFKAHKLIHTGEKSFVCPTCGKRFLRKVSLTAHVEVHNKGQFPCHKCSIIRGTPSSLKMHLRKCHPRKMSPCSICGKEFKRKSNCTVHYERVHLQKGKFSCSKCNQLFKTKNLLQLHMLDYGRDYYCCPHCKIGFISNSDLEEHWTSHEGRPLICTKCKEVCPTMVAYDNHSCSHRVDHPCKVTCVFCEKLLRMTSLKRHMRRKHAELEKEAGEVTSSHSKRKFQCLVCDKLLPSSASRIWHGIFAHNLVNDLDSNVASSATGVELSKSCASQDGSNENTPHSKSNDRKCIEDPIFVKQENTDELGTDCSGEESSCFDAVFIKEENVEVDSDRHEQSGDSSNVEEGSHMDCLEC